MYAQYKDSEFSLSMNDVEKMLNSAKNHRDKYIIGTLYFAALRREEVAKLEVKDLDFERGSITLVGKGDKLAVLPTGHLFPAYMAEMRMFIGHRKTGPVFLSNRKGMMEVSNINKIVEQTAALAGVKSPNPKHTHVHPHLLRHSLARHLKSLRFPVEFIQKYMRHSSFKTTMDVYGTLGYDEMVEIADDHRRQLK